MLAALLAGCGEAREPGRTVVDSPDTLGLVERRGIPGWIAFVSERDGDPEVYGIDPTGSEWRITRHPAADYPAAAAPDGSALLLIRVEEEIERAGSAQPHRERLLLHPLNGEGSVQLGPATARVRNPAGSPDGRWIVWESDAKSFRDLYRVDHDGENLDRLTDDPQGNFEPSISSDGAWIAFVSSRDGDAEIYRMRSDGSAQQRLTAFHRDDTGPRWSPDGSSIAFLSDREGEDRIWVMAPDGTGQRRLTPEGTAGMREEAPVWSPDGSSIAYVERDRDGRGAVWVTEVATGMRTRISGERGSDENPAWSPDGRYLALVSDRDGDPELYLVRADGSAPTRLTRSPGADWLPRWVPDPGR